VHLQAAVLECWEIDFTLRLPFFYSVTRDRVNDELYQVDDNQLKALDQFKGYNGPGIYNYYDRAE
jgi:gamma-glutamylcyclotransferase (GGCT)/AIG2-like uncharacterized protein YtfP